MPGLSFIYNLKNGREVTQDRIAHSLDALLHTGDYSKEFLVMCEQCVLACTRYPEYPLQVLDLPDYTVVIEGRLYDLTNDNITNEMKKLTQILFEESREYLSLMTNWLLNTDGEFIIFLLNKKTNHIAIFNDVLGRLPWYCFKERELIILSREIRFITQLIAQHNCDRMAIAQFLLFGYPLGNRTLLENVKRLPPATLVLINESTSMISLESLYTFNFDLKRHSDKTIEVNSAELAAELRKSCRHRVNSTNTNLVSLSGGLDSRTVSASFHAQGLPFVSATFLMHDKSNSSEVTIAAQLAKLYNCDWQTYSLNPPLGRHLLQLLNMKMGLNYLGMSWILPFFEKIKEAQGNSTTYFTGDGGDKVFPDCRPARRFRSLENIAAFILQRHQILMLNKVAALTQLDKSEIVAELVAHLATYPEQDLAQKYVHFIIYERGMKWLFEGEDRNRFYFWSVSPFYSIRFFTYAMNCPDSQKKCYLLYRHVLKELSELAVEVPDDNVGLPPDSRWHGIKRACKSWVGDWMPAGFRMQLQQNDSYNLRSPLVSCLRKQVDNCSRIRNYFSTGALKSILENCNNHSRFQLENLFSVTSLIEELDTESSSIEQYIDTHFL